MAGSVLLEGEVVPHAAAMLRDVCRVLKACGVSYCLDGGTLLGIVREQRFLPWDNDMDLYVDGSQVVRLKIAALLLKLKGFHVARKKLKLDIGPLKTGVLRLIKVQRKLPDGRNLLVDIIAKHHVEGSAYWVVGVTNPVLKSVPSHYYLKRDSISFGGEIYATPSDVGEYLGVRYGDWRKQVKEWDFQRDDLAIVAKKDQTS